MRWFRESRRFRAFIAIVVALAIWVVAVDVAFAEPPTAGQEPVAEDAGFFQLLWQNLFNSRGLLNILSKPEFMSLAFIALNVIVFVETGLLIGFFLPGDSLLVTAGVACYLAEWNLPMLLLTLSLSAILGDSVGYSIGFKAGPKIFNREKSFFFKKDHLLKAQEFYEDRKSVV